MQARGAGTGGLLETRLQVCRRKTDSVNSPLGFFFKERKKNSTFFFKTPQHARFLTVEAGNRADAEKSTSLIH